MRTACLCFLLLLPAVAAAQGLTATVGMTVRINQLVLPGTELEAAPQQDRSAKMVVRIARVYPHGTDFRYDLEFQGMEPGTFDLRPYLRRKDGSSTADLPAIPVTITSLLPGGQITPNALELHTPPFLGGYRVLMIIGGVVWVLGLVAIIYIGFIRRVRSDAAAQAQAPLTLADRLRPLVEGAMAGKLSQPQLASLERTLLAYWRRRLDLDRADPAQAMDNLRRHPEAGPLLEQLEVWLHRAEPARSVDPAALLAPYQNLPADALEVSSR